MYPIIAVLIVGNSLACIWRESDFTVLKISTSFVHPLFSIFSSKVIQSSLGTNLGKD